MKGAVVKQGVVHNSRRSCKNSCNKFVYYFLGFGGISKSSNYKKELVKKITLSQEEYAEKYGKNKSIQSDSIKRKERIKNIDIELENWRNLKSNSEKMTTKLKERKDKIKFELNENKKNPD